jgi:hypothetical protein
MTAQRCAAALAAAHCFYGAPLQQRCSKSVVKMHQFAAKAAALWLSSSS